MSLARGLTFPLAKSSWLAALTQFFERFSLFPLEIIHEISYAHSIEVYVFPLALPYLRIRLRGQASAPG